MVIPSVSGALLDERIAGAARRAFHRVAIVDGAKRVTFGELQAAIDVLAGAYRGRGLRRGDRILCQVSNRWEHLVAMAAAWRLGAVHVGVDHDLTLPEVTRLIVLTGAAALVHEPHGATVGTLAVPAGVAAAHPAVQVITLDGNDPRFTELGTLMHYAPAQRADEGSEPRGDVRSADDPAVIFVTSGTSGIPKTPIACHGDLVEGWEGFADELCFGPHDVHLGHLPLTHGFGMSLAYMALASGGRLVLMPRFSPEEALCLVAKEGVTILNGTPTHFILLTNKLDPTRHDVSSLRTGIGSASAFPPQLLRRIFLDLGMDLMLMYGSSEGVGVATTDREDMLLGAVGRPIPGLVAIVGPDRRPLPAGQIGEIAFNRDVAEVEYWSESGAPATDGGGLVASWYYSGDLGKMDEEGRLYVLGRLKHQIDRGGLKVDPGEVEQALVRLPGVLDAAVIGTTNPVLGETVCACVVPAAGEAPTLGELRAALATELAPHKLPEELCLLDELPRTGLGKVERGALADLVASSRRERLPVR